MYTLAQISEALQRFADLSSEDNEIRQLTNEMIRKGELEVIDIIDGEFVLRKARNGS